MIIANKKKITSISRNGNNIQYVLSGANLVFPDRSTPNVVICHNGEIKSVPVDDLDNYDTAMPMGVEVIPKEHDVYGTGEGAMMSLVNMSQSTPATGQTDVSGGQLTMEWDVGQNILTAPQITGTDAKYWKNFNLIDNDAKATLVGALGQPSNTYEDKNIQTSSPAASIPTDAVVNKTSCASDLFCQYNLTSSFCPGPYYTDGSRNPSFYSTELESDNVFSNFGGKEESKLIIEQWRDKSSSKDYSSWLPSGAKSVPAISTCDMFVSGCSEPGEWYLPSVAEICYVAARFKEINKALAAIKEKFGYGYELHPNGYYWTSTLLNAKTGMYWYVNRGQIMSYGLSSKALVRAFKRFK